MKKTNRPTSTSFQRVPECACGSAKAEMNNQAPRAVFTHRTAGMLIASTARTTMASPTAQSLTRSAGV